MRFLAGCASVFGVVLALIVSAGSANAQATRTWVSGVGDDANPCSRTAPCKTFAGAISKTAAFGEINVLDPGGFGAVTITKSISIISKSFEAGVLVAGTNEIIVNVASTDRVVLEGLDIEGLGSGLNGVWVLGSGRIYIRKCRISRFHRQCRQRGWNRKCARCRRGQPTAVQRRRVCAGGQRGCQFRVPHQFDFQLQC